MVILPNDRVLLLTQERIKTMSDTKISLNNEAARIKQIIEEKEKKRKREILQSLLPFPLLIERYGN